MSSTVESNVSSCRALGTGSSKDSGLSLVLGLNIAYASFIFILFCVMHVFLKDYIMAAVSSNKRAGWPSSRQVQEDELSEGLVDDEESKHKEVKSRCQISAGRSYCDSIINFLLMREDDVRERSGPDASLYLTMELYMLTILLVYTFFSIGIILPINYLSGDLQIDLPFARTTIANVDPESPAPWSHVLFSVLYVLIAGLFMIHYFMRLGKLQRRKSSHTVMIVGVPDSVDGEDLKLHFEEALPGTQIVDIRFAYDVGQLQKLWNELQGAIANLEMAESYEAHNIKPLMIHSSWCICSKKNLVVAKKYYSTKVDNLKVSVATERNNALSQRLPIAFVTFAGYVAPTKFVDSYKCCRQKPESSLTDNIRSKSWEVSLSPYAQDLQWQNLNSTKAFWWIRWFVINLTLLAFAIFFTTPAVLINGSEEIWLFVKKEAGTVNITIKNASGYGVPTFVQSYVSSFFTWLLSYLLLFCVTRSVNIEYHWSKSRRAQTTLRKAVAFLTIQVLILPSLGLTSLSALAALTVHGHEADLYDRLSCVFLPNNGAFFVSYIIVATFFFAPLELLRLPRLIEYVFRRVSIDKKLTRRKTIEKILRHDFKLGSEYAAILLIFTVTTSLSLITPLIVPFGAVYFCVKYLVDKYNLLYGYRPISMCGRQYLHKSAMKLVMVGAVCLQFVTLFYSVVREGKLRPRSILMTVIVSITCILLFGILVLGWFSHLLPKIRIKLGREYSIFGYDDEDCRIIEPGEYIAPVLQETADYSTGTDDGVTP